MNYPKVYTHVTVVMDNGTDRLVFSGSSQDLNDRIEKIWKYLPFTIDDVKITESATEIIYT